MPVQVAATPVAFEQATPDAPAAKLIVVTQVPAQVPEHALALFNVTPVEHVPLQLNPVGQAVAVTLSEQLPKQIGEPLLQTPLD